MRTDDRGRNEGTLTGNDGHDAGLERASKSLPPDERYRKHLLAELTPISIRQATVQCGFFLGAWWQCTRAIPSCQFVDPRGTSSIL